MIDIIGRVIVIKCVNCKQTIPETSKVCPYCKNDPNIEVINVTDFGEINENNYANDDRFDIKTYIKEPKNKKNVLLIFSAILVVFIILVILIFMLTRPKKDNSYKYFTGVVNKIHDYLSEEYFSNSSVKSGDYSLELDLSNYKTKFEGSYSLDAKSRVLTIDGHMRDPKEDEGGIVLESKEFTYELYSNLNNVYFKSKEFYNDDYILFPIEDNVGFLKSKKYDMNSILDGVSDAVNAALKRLSYKKESTTINYRGDNTNTKKVYIELNNANLREFYNTFYDTLIDDSNFINELVRVTEKRENEITETLENYKKTQDFKYNTENETSNKLAIYYTGKKIIRISLEYGENIYDFDIGDTKYYFKEYKNSEEILNVDFTSVEKQVQDIINKTYEINYKKGELSGTITLKLVTNTKPKVKKVEIEKYKSVREFTDEDLTQIKTNMSYYGDKLPDLIQKLFDSFDYRCKESLECICETGSDKCSCAYNGGMITCKKEDVKK